MTSAVSAVSAVTYLGHPLPYAVPYQKRTKHGDQIAEAPDSASFVARTYSALLTEASSKIEA